VAITIPGDYNHVKKAELVGYVPAAVEPVNTLAQRTHWFYRYHSPALFTGMVWNSAATTHTAFFPVSPSADGISYDIQAAISYAGNDTFTLQAFYTTGSATNGATWVSIGSDADALSGAPNTSAGLIVSGAVPSTAKFIKITTTTAGSTNHQITGVVMHPSANHTPSAMNASGFVAFDDGFLATGAPIHTEYLNRCVNNVEAVYKDRKWCVFSFIQTDSLGYRLAGSAAGAFRTIGKAQVTMPDDLLTRTATVRVRANDSSGSDGYVEVYQVNGQTTGTTLTADNTDRSTSLKITGSEPIIACRAVANGTIDVYYVTVEVAPTLEKQGSGKDMITAAAPPARTEYLTTIDGIQSRLYWQSYPVTGVVMNVDQYTSLHATLPVRVGPGVKRFRPCVTRYVTGDGADTVVGPAVFVNTDSGTASHERIHVNTESTGDTERHPISGSTDEQKTAKGFIEWGAEIEMPSPDASTYASGLSRLCEIVESDQPQTEIFSQFIATYGFGGRYIKTADVTTL
tara:strand:- start:1393 stop:2934 length:1542 start_codon:yes stop_codon:yes gene_type:complete